MSLDLKNKRILFIGPVFYDYQLIIKSKLESYGAEVIFFGERDYTFKFKIANNLFNKNIDAFQKKHYDRILNKVSLTDFDFLFVIRGYKIPIEFVKKFKDLNPNSKTIMYQWDSIKNNEYIHLLPHFDILFSFDKSDVERNSSLKYLPLFYSDDIKKLGDYDNKNSFRYDVFFFGYYLPERYEMMLRLLEFSRNKNIVLKTFLYIPFTRYVKEILKGNRIRFSIVSFKPLKRSEYLSLLRDSNAIFDSSSITQSGLSMRVIETIGAKRKLITSNAYIKTDNIYNPKQILVVSPNNLEETLPFLKTEIDNYSKGYSLDQWLSTIFNQVN